MIRDITVSVTTDESGDGTTTSTEAVVGRLVAIVTDVDGLDAGADSTIGFTGTGTALTLTDVVANATYHVRALGSTSAGASSSEYVHPLAVGYPTVTVAQGGNTKTATYTFYVET